MKKFWKEKLQSIRDQLDEMRNVVDMQLADAKSEKKSDQLGILSDQLTLAIDNLDTALEEA